MVNPEVFWTNTTSKMGFMRQSDLARAIKVTPQQISQWKRKNLVPRGDITLAIARAVGSTVEELLSDEVKA